MTELVGSHTASIQKLEIQMRDLSREQNPKQKGTLPSDTIVNPKGSESGSTSHVMEITTRSGKILQGEGEQVVEIEEPPPPFRQRLTRKVDDSKLEKFYDILKQLSVNIPFVEAFQEMSSFAKYLKDLITKKKTTKNEVVNVTHRVSSIITTSPVQKKEDPRAFTIPCTIGVHDFTRSLCDNGASINLMPLAIYKKAGLVMLRPTSMRLQMADRSIKCLVGIIDDVLVKVRKFHLPADFVILDCAVDKEIPIILGRPFLATGRALMHSERNEIKFPVNDEEVTFQASKDMKLPHEYERISVIDVVDEVEDAVEIKMEEQCLGEALAAILVNFDGEDMEGYMELVNVLERLGSYTYVPEKLSLDLENRATPPAKPSIIEPLQLELKPLPPHLRYEFLGSNDTLPVIVYSLLNDVQVERLLEVLKEHRQAIRWTIADIRGIPKGICEHKIQLESETKPSVEHQRRFNPSMQEVFWAYLLGSKVIVYTDHATLHYLMSKKDAKPQLIRWVLLFQEFDFEVKDHKGTQNQVADHLSRLEEAGRPKGDLEINDAFSDEHILALSSTFAPWCVPKEEIMPILKACHETPVGGHHGGNRTAAKVLECGYYWPSIYHYANQMVKACGKCQRQGSISKRHEMPMHFVMEIEIFDV
ncbi:uncharacterized protein LOC142161953 [Nicotiana tabacum]|uniref:Uncharacterized protein LOC142161953 n=1 Tax=Nicotiana tabacum TaxID=4097 RepID=A0AC58RNN2_TOBAC